MEVQALWREVIGDKYGIKVGGWRTRDIVLPFGCGLWRNIMKRWDYFVENISFKVGVGRRVYFWEHNWCGKLILKEEFQSLYSISCQRDLTIQQIRRSHGGKTFWDLRFRRDFQDWEVSEFHRLIDLVHRQVNLVDNPDVWWWGLGSKEVFSVKSFYENFGQGGG